MQGLIHEKQKDFESCKLHKFLWVSFHLLSVNRLTYVWKLCGRQGRPWPGGLLLLEHLPAKVRPDIKGFLEILCHPEPRLQKTLRDLWDSGAMLSSEMRALLTDVCWSI